MELIALGSSTGNSQIKPKGNDWLQPSEVSTVLKKFHLQETNLKSNWML